MDALVLCVLESVGGHVNILLDGSCECANGGPCDSLRYLNDRVEVAGAGDREAGLDHVNAKRLECLGDLYFLYCVELAAWHLLAIAQRGVENIDSVVHPTKVWFLYVSVLLIQDIAGGGKWQSTQKGCCVNPPPRRISRSEGLPGGEPDNP